MFRQPCDTGCDPFQTDIQVNCHRGSNVGLLVSGAELS